MDAQQPVPSGQTTTWSRRAFDYWNSFSFTGLVAGMLFFIASVTPSLIPRPYIAQGILSGLAIALGYAVGVGIVWAYQYLQLPAPSLGIERTTKRVTSVTVAFAFVLFLYEMTTWQNSIRVLMEMEPLRSAYPIRVALISVATACVLLAVVRRIRRIAIWIADRLKPFVPPRVAKLLSVCAVACGLFFMVNGVIAKLLLNFADRVSLAADRMIEEDISQPTAPMSTGSSESLVSWESIGRQGKHFISLGPSESDLIDFWGEANKASIQTPIRVYAGIDTAETPEQRAAIALDELIRVGGFERSLLVVATPTGTGWLDPSAVDTLEYMHKGDTAIVALQYSYLPSFITIAVDPNRSMKTAQALFEAVYEHWTTLPPETRPRLYLHGLSLGSLGSEMSADLFTIFEDPIHGAVWSGPPFPSRRWSAITAARNDKSPAWLPTFHNGQIVRFTAQQNALRTGQRWSRIRCVYIQYASDPMVFFSPSLFVRRPEWLDGSRGPDVSPILTWVPIVTGLQVAFDMALATTVPLGYGHNYSPASYIAAWDAVTEPAEWNETLSIKLHQRLSNRTVSQ